MRSSLTGLRGRLADTGRRGVGVGGVAGLQALGQQDLDPGGDRDRHQRADQPEGGAADQAGQQHGERHTPSAASAPNAARLATREISMFPIM